MAKSIFDTELKGLMDMFPKVAKMARDAFADIDDSIGHTRKNLAILERTIELDIDVSAIEKANRPVLRLERSLRELAYGKYKVHIGMDGTATGKSNFSGMGFNWFKGSSKSGSGFKLGDFFKGGGEGAAAAGEEAEMMEAAAGGAAGGPVGIAAAIAAEKIKQGAKKVAEVAYEFGRQGLEASIDKERQVQKFSPYIGKAQGNELYSDLMAGVPRAGFELENAVPLAQELLAGGLTKNKTEHDLYYLMNALNARGYRGDANMLDLMGGHLSRMAASGRMDEEAMNDFETKAHIPMTKLLSGYTGFSEQNISAWNDNGTLKDHITYDMFIGALDRAGRAGGMFGDAITEQSDTIGGRLELIESKWHEGLSSMFDDPEAKNGIKKIEDTILKAMEGLPELSRKFGRGVGITAGWLADAYNYFFDHDRYKRDQQEEFAQREEALGSQVTPTDAIRIKGLNMGAIDQLAAENQKATFGDQLVNHNTSAVYGPYTKAYKDAHDPYKNMFGFAPLNLEAVPQNATGTQKATVPYKEHTAETSNAITGGGEKQIIINVKSFAEQFNVYAQNVKDGGQQVKETFERMFLEVLMSANTAM